MATKTRPTTNRYTASLRQQPERTARWLVPGLSQMSQWIASNRLLAQYAAVRDKFAGVIGGGGFLSVVSIRSLPPLKTLELLWEPWFAPALSAITADEALLNSVAMHAAVGGWRTGLFSRGAPIERVGSVRWLSSSHGVLRVEGEVGRLGYRAYRKLVTPLQGSAQYQGLTIHLDPVIAQTLATTSLEPGVEGSSPSVRALTIESDPGAVWRSLRNLQLALDAISGFGALRWVRTFVRHIVLLTTDEAYSGRYGVSTPECYGVACIDARGTVADVVETLVHEASHQAVYVAELGRPLISETVYAPSPFRRGLRTLRRVFAGAHAFHNSRLALAAFHPAPDQIEGVRRRMLDLSTRVSEAVEILQDHMSVTPAAQRWLAQIQRHNPQSNRVQEEISSRPVASTWSDLTSKEAWFARIEDRATVWKPLDELGTSAELVKTALLSAIRRRQEWVYHPSLSSIFDVSDGKLQRDFQLIAWVAAHSVGHVVEAPTDGLRLWTAEGVFSVPHGTVTISLVDDAKTGPKLPVSVDAMASLVASKHEDYWTPRRVRQERLAFEESIRTVLLSLDTLQQMSSNCLTWIAHVTKALVPLRRGARTSLRSYSRTDVPGLVFLDTWGGVVPTLELLVHESAHLHFFLREAGGALVDPNDGRLYWSPLRRDPRPLRGIFLAYHALAFMYAVYTEIREGGLICEREVTRTLAGLLSKVRACEAILESSSSLTEAGQRLFEVTKEVTNA